MIWNADDITKLATGYWASAAIGAAVELGLFGILNRDALSAAEIAGRASTAERHTAELLHALTALGLLVKTGDRFSIEASAQALLAADSPTCMLPALRFNVDLYKLWGLLPAAVREGRPVVPPSAHLGDNPERTKHFVHGMHSRATALAPALLPALDLTGCRTLLDLAAGPGTFSRELALKYPQLEVTQFDLPPVLALAETLAATSPTRDRLRFVPGNYRSDALPGPFDAVLYCGALHQEEETSAAAVIRKIHTALRPGGRALIVDMMLNDDRTGPAFSALFSINMMLTSPAGRVFRVSEARALLADAGFRNVRDSAVPRSPYHVIQAER